jgi:hypothetical protein
VFTPTELVGFDFSQYRVVVLNWDDTFAGDFLCPYTTALPALEVYAAAEGVVLVQGAIQDGCYPLPFGGRSWIDFGVEDPIVDICSPMMLGVSNPIVGDAASHVTDTDLPPAAHVVVINDNNGNPVLYDLECPKAKPTPTPTPALCGTRLIHNDGFETGHFNRGLTSTVDLTSYIGQTIRVRFLVHQDGFGALTGIFVDDVQLTLPCGSASPTPAPRATPVPRPRPTPRPHPLGYLENVKAGARERLAGSPVCGGLPIRKAWCFAHQVSAL